MPPLLPHLKPNGYFIEPCAGAGVLTAHLEAAGQRCAGEYDVVPQHRAAPRWPLEAFDATIAGYGGGPGGKSKSSPPHADYFITNPPWDRKLLHPIIVNLSDQLPTWLLFDADWVHTRQAAPYLDRLRKIVSVGRLKWIEGSKFTGKDNVAWHLFGAPSSEPAQFVGRSK